MYACISQFIRAAKRGSNAGKYGSQDVKYEEKQDIYVATRVK